MTHFFANLFSFRKKVDSDKGQKKASAASAAEVKAEFDQVLFDFSSYWTIKSMEGTCYIIPKSLYWGLGLSLIHSKGILGWWSRYGMWYLILKLSKSFYYESDLLFLVHHWGRLTSHLRVVRDSINLCSQRRIVTSPLNSVVVNWHGPFPATSLTLVSWAGRPTVPFIAAILLRFKTSPAIAIATLKWK